MRLSGTKELLLFFLTNVRLSLVYANIEKKQKNGTNQLSENLKNENYTFLVIIIRIIIIIITIIIVIIIVIIIILKVQRRKVNMKHFWDNCYCLLTIWYIL